jgi:hypothetical protein
MSERIKELIKQVGTDVSGKWMNVDNVEEFANLIIQECNNLNKQVLIQSNLGHYMVIERLINKYQDHFGLDNE